MAARFSSYDAIIAALTDDGKGQEANFNKITAAALAAGAVSSSWAYTGAPGAGTWAGAGGAVGGSATLVHCNSSTSGAIPLSSPTSASGTNPFLTALGAYASGAAQGTLILIDRLADTGALSGSAGTISITMPTGSAWSRYASGVGVQAFVESLGSAPATAATIQLSQYTNTASSSGRASGSTPTTTGTYRAFGGTSAQPNSTPFMNLQTGDLGIKSIEQVTVSAAAASNIALVVCKPLASIPLGAAYQYLERDLVLQSPKMPRLDVTSGDQTACLQFLIVGGAAVQPIIVGTINLVTG